MTGAGTSSDRASRRNSGLLAYAACIVFAASVWFAVRVTAPEPLQVRWQGVLTTGTTEMARVAKPHSPKQYSLSGVDPDAPIGSGFDQASTTPAVRGNQTSETIP